MIKMPFLPITDGSPSRNVASPETINKINRFTMPCVYLLLLSNTFPFHSPNTLQAAILWLQNCQITSRNLIQLLAQADTAQEK